MFLWHQVQRSNLQHNLGRILTTTQSPSSSITAWLRSHLWNKDVCFVTISFSQEILNLTCFIKIAIYMLDIQTFHPCARLVGVKIYCFRAAVENKLSGTKRWATEGRYLHSASVLISEEKIHHHLREAQEGHLYQVGLVLQLHPKSNTIKKSYIFYKYLSYF